MGEREPQVSVIIPTYRRPVLVLRAVKSVLAQTVGDLELIVVMDGPDDATREALTSIVDNRMTVKITPQRRGPVHALNTGVQAARGHWVAFLDDDDLWLPQKLECQLKVAQTSRYRYPIVGCRIRSRREGGDLIVPRRMPRPGEPISEYMFLRRQLLWGEGGMHPSTFLTKTELARQVPFRPEVLRHEDYDWLLRAAIVDGAGVTLAWEPGPLAVCDQSVGSDRRSNTGDWRELLAWVQAEGDLLTRRAYVSFVTTGVAAAAAREGDWRNFVPLLREAYRAGKPTALELLIYVGLWLVPWRIRWRLAVRFAPGR